MEAPTKRRRATKVEMKFRALVHLKGFEWPWCNTHDAPYVARREGFECPWADETCVTPASVWIKHQWRSFSRPLKFADMKES